jgi:hypothetical protein
MPRWPKKANLVRKPEPPSEVIIHKVDPTQVLILLKTSDNVVSTTLSVNPGQLHNTATQAMQNFLELCFLTNKKVLSVEVVVNFQESTEGTEE